MPPVRPFQGDATIAPVPVIVTFTYSGTITTCVAAAAPRYVRREEVPAELLEKERTIFQTQARESGKPPAVIEKIVAGRIEKFYSEICLLEQPFVKEPGVTIKDLISQKIAKLGENISVRRFTRYRLGEE